MPQLSELQLTLPFETPRTLVAPLEVGVDHVLLLGPEGRHFYCKAAPDMCEEFRRAQRKQELAWAILSPRGDEDGISFAEVIDAEFWHPVP